MKKVTAFFMILVMLFFIGGIYINIYSASIKTDSYSWGSSGSTVSEIQRRLKDWGYYNGDVDGIFGSQTHDAVIYFQQKNGLAVDGIVGPETLAALGMQSGSGGNRNSDLDLLAKAITGEARGEPYVGQVAVGAVIINRTRHPEFPGTIAGVIYQPGAFTAVSDGQIYLEPTDSALRAARDALNGWDPSGGAIYYYNPAKATSSWIWSRPVIKVIGDHYFCN